MGEHFARGRSAEVFRTEDGKLLKENLRLSGKNDTWLRRVLEEHSATVEKTWLLTVDASDKVLWLQKEGTK